MNESIKIPEPLPRSFLPSDFQVQSWSDLEPWFEDLLADDISTEEKLIQWLYKSSELENFLFEARAWLFIAMTRNTADEAAANQYRSFLSDIYPRLFEYGNRLRKKLAASPAFSSLDPKQFEVLTRAVKKEIELFREENIALISKEQQTAQRFDQIAGNLSVNVKGESVTLQKAGTFLEDKDRQFRKEVWEKISKSRLNTEKDLDNLYDELIQIRHQVGQNAGFDSFADYKMLSMGRFDYGREECFRFHDSVKSAIMPIYESFMEERRQKLGVSTLKPWDSMVNLYGDQPLRPFTNSGELLKKAAKVFNRLDPGWGEKLLIMEKMGHLDLDNRINKAPGGYNYSLPEKGVPFIFMNAVGTQNDLTTMMHEGGHALHSFAAQDIRISDFKNIPSEIAELAAMSMELITMDYWTEFYDNEEDWTRARREQIQRPISILPWIVTVDKFQFWAYDNPKAGTEARKEAWKSIYLDLHGKPFDWTDHEDTARTSWHKQRHIFDLPFYYIEYGIAQLGAIAIWRNFRRDPQKALKDFWNGLSMGYKRPIPEVYEAAGIKFDFSEAYIAELAEFLLEELRQLDA